MEKSLQGIGLMLTAIVYGNILQAQNKENQSPYNILMIAVDDLNDYVGFLGGHPQTRTPNMDKLATEGVVFERAYCSAAVSNPSRASLMTGFRANTSGIKVNQTNFRTIDILNQAITIPQYLSAHGYYTMQRGKIFHEAIGSMSDSISWDLQVSPTGSFGIPPMNPGFRANGIPNTSGDSNFDWGPTSKTLEETPDFGNALWAANELNKEHDKPFMIACGFFRPHLPFYVPQQFFDKFPEETMILPAINDDDLADVPGNIKPSEDYLEALQYGKRKAALQAYLACINYADTCVGVVLNALRKSKYADNTIVIFWGDHGWHLGEKLRYKKFTPWEEACRMPFVIKVPGMTKENSRCKVPVNLMDLYPTITELCGLPDNTNNEGESMVSLLKNPESKQSTFSWTTQDGQSIRSDDFRYIRRTTGDELYDHRIDEMEWNNLAGNPLYTSIKNRLSDITDSLMLQQKTKLRSAIRKNKIPGVMQAEKFDRGGEGVGYHDTDATNNGGKFRKVEGVDIQASNDIGGGFCVSSTSKDEWLAFTIDSIKPGKYFIQARIISAQSGGIIDTKLNGATISSLSIPISSTWQTVSSDTITLTQAYKADLQFRFSQSGFSVNYFEFVKVGELPTALPNLRNNTTVIYPNSVNGTLYLNVFEFDTDVTVTLMTLTGKVLWKSGKLTDSVEIPVDATWHDGVILALIQGKNKSEVQKVIISK